MGAIICPTLLFIENCDWEDNEKHDQFLYNLQKTFEYASQHSIQIYWNDELEYTLWCQPNLHPWLAQDTTSSTLLLYSCIRNLEESCGYSKCNCKPDIISSIYSKDVISPILSLFHYTIDKNENVSFIVDENNNHHFIFNCDCHTNKLEPQIIYIFDDIINISEEINKSWSKIKEDSSVFTNLLEITRLKYFADKKFVYQPTYESSFIRSIYKVVEKKERILYDITHRLTLYPHEAAMIKSFNDENISGRKRSFRVNDVCRVYYDYNDGNKILFKEYTGESKHDKGTRHT